MFVKVFIQKHDSHVCVQARLCLMRNVIGNPTVLGSMKMMC